MDRFANSTGLHLPDCLQAAGMIGAWAHDTATDLVVMDPAVAQLVGMTGSDPANGDPFDRYFEAIHPADRHGFLSAVRTASEKGSHFASQYRVRTSAGVRWIQDYGSFTVDSEGRPIQGQGIIIDITHGRREVDAVHELALATPPDLQLQGHLNALASHTIAASEIARVLPSARLRALTDPLLCEVGRLLAWAMSRRV